MNNKQHSYATANPVRDKRCYDLAANSCCICNYEGAL